MAKGIAETEADPAARVHLAQAFCGSALSRFWQKTCEQNRCSWEIRTPPVSLDLHDSETLSLARAAGDAAAGYPILQSGYLISSLYTVMLPEDIRSRLGAYYTPPALAERLMDMVTDAGFDWKKGRILDPACGGGAFLAHAALRMLNTLTPSDSAFALRNLSTRLQGFEIDPFASWLSQVLLEAALLETCRRANRRLPDVVITGNALTLPVDDQRPYDLVIGNPPYGKITLPEMERRIYRRSLYGHANLYGLFTDLAIRWVTPGGIIGYVTPTSFLGGQYFKALRSLLLREAPPLKMNFITERQGVFEDVLQETMLSVYKRDQKRKRPVKVDFLRPNGDEKPVSVQKVGRFTLPTNAEEPWYLPRDREHVALLRKFTALPHRLSDYGFSVNTGQLVWNRHKAQLRSDLSKECYPLLWAESVTSEGEFSFSAVRRNHQPFFRLYSGQEYLLTREPCVLVQRTTAKEQKRRLIAALLSEDFIREYGGVVVENHLNMIRPSVRNPGTSPRVIAAILNTRSLDIAFRCISGSVAVSAFELNTLPMPSPDEMDAIERLLRSGAARETIEKTVAQVYGVQA
ncbi:MAG: N-6 DNA methylase [Deltaproteobacteria bacterium]|nr:N-6 DNA methylase [Deltaproteobacteria bacterium]